MQKQQISLIEIAKVFLIIGATGLGGGIAIIALMRDYCVDRKKWLSNEELIHGIALGQFLGSFAVNVSIFIGYKIRGLKGAIVALTSFLAPSVSLVILLSALYMHFHKIPALHSALNGIAPVVVALILTAAFKMGAGRIKSAESILLVIISIFLSLVCKMQIVAILALALIYGFLKVRFFNPNSSGGD